MQSQELDKLVNVLVQSSLKHVNPLHLISSGQGYAVQQLCKLPDVLLNSPIFLLEILQILLKLLSDTVGEEASVQKTAKLRSSKQLGP